MKYVFATVALGSKLLPAKTLALSAVLAEMETGELYCVELAVGSLPSVVYRMIPPVCVVVSVTVWVVG
jgi:hypothetical protein